MGINAASDNIRLASYNLAGGNKTYRENWDQTRDHMVNAMGSTQRNPVDVAFLQEVASHDENYPRELIEGLMANYCEVGEEVREQGFSADGVPTDDVEDADIRVYSTTRDNGDTYSAVFGVSDNPDFGGPEDSYKDRNYGNGLLLGPEFKLRTDENGNIEAGQLQVNQIGSNSESGEPRTALSAQVEGPNGQDTTLVSTHFTHDSDADRRSQYEVLFNQHRGAENVIIGGDFNSTPGDPAVGNPGPQEAGLQKIASDPGHGLDHILVSSNLKKVQGSDRVRPGGGSDHELLQVDIKAPGAGEEARSPAPASAPTPGGTKSSSAPTTTTNSGSSKPSASTTSSSRPTSSSSEE